MSTNAVIPLRTHVRAFQPILMVGIASELVYLIYFVVFFPLLSRYNRYHFFTDVVTSLPSLAGVIVAFTGLFCLLVLAWTQLGGLPERGLLMIVLGFGSLFSLTLLFVYPIHGLDIYKYAEAGTIFLVHHHNPMTTAPAAFPHDVFTPLTDGLKTSPSPYGPLGILLDSLPTPIASGNVLANVLLLKGLAAFFVLADAYLVYRLLVPAARRAALCGALLIAWNPLILFEAVVNGHNDASVGFFVLLGLLATARGHTVLGVTSVTASALVKYGTLPLVPLFLVYGLRAEFDLREKLRYVGQSSVSGLAIAVVLYAPFWAGTDTFRRSIQEDQKHFYSFSATVHSLFGDISAGSASIVGRSLFLLVYGVVLWKASRRNLDLPRLTYLTLFAFLALGVDTFRAWYALWAMFPAMAVSGFTDRVWVVTFAYLVTVGVMIYSYGPGAGGFVNVFPDTRPYFVTFPASLVFLVAIFVSRNTTTRAVP